MEKTRVYQNSQISDSPTIIENAGAAIDDVRCRLVKYDENGDVVLCAAGDAPLGVAIITNSSSHVKGDPVDIQIRGSGLVMVGAAVAKGDTLISDANGKAVKGTGNVIGIALEAATAANAVIRFIMSHSFASPSKVET